MTLETWRKDALEHSLWLLDTAGREYALQAADEAENTSEGVLAGLGKRLRQEIEKRRAAKGTS